MIDRQHFFDTVRAELFGGSMSGKQVQGMERILEQYEVSGWSDKRWLAYVLATVFHETAKQMQPVTERGGQAYLMRKKYYPYYGRDLVHTTWKANYEKVKQFSGIDVVAHPDLIAQLELAVQVAFKFMEKGWYTGKALKHYFNGVDNDWFNARRIINGTDRAELVAGYGRKFLSAIQFT